MLQYVTGSQSTADMLAAAAGDASATLTRHHLVMTLTATHCCRSFPTCVYSVGQKSCCFWKFATPIRRCSDEVEVKVSKESKRGHLYLIAHRRERASNALPLPISRR